MINFDNKAELKRSKVEKKYIKFLTYSLADPISKTFRKILILLKEQVGYVYLIFTLISSGFATVLTKYLLMGRLSPYHILVYTSFLGLVILVVFNYKKGIKKFVKSKLGFRWLIVAGLTGFAIYELTFNFALECLPVTQTIVIYYTNPIFLYFAGLLFLNREENKKVNKKILLGIFLSFIGVYIVITGGKFITFTLNIGVLYILISIISVTIFTILVKKKEIPEFQFLFWGQTIALIGGGIVLWITDGWILPTFEEAVYLIFVTVIYNILNLIFYLKTIQYLSVEKLSTLMYMSPIITSGLAVLLLNEPLMASTIVGLILVIIGNIIANI